MHNLRGMLAAMGYEPSLRVFVLSHSQSILDAVPPSPSFELVNLSELDLGELQTNQLGECRAFFRDFSDIEEEYIGFANARWDQKYFQLRTRLSNLESSAKRLLAPGWVLAPWPAYDWYPATLHFHPSMKQLLDELLGSRALSGSTGRTSLWANDFICHKSVFMDWHRFWHECFNYFQAKYGLELPFGTEGTDPSRHAAFFFERVTTVYFANRFDVQVAPLE